MAHTEEQKKWLATFLETRNQSETSRIHGVPLSTLNKFLQTFPDLYKERYSKKEFEYWINLYFCGFGVTAISRITSRSRHTITKFLKKFDVYEELFIYTKDIIENFAKSKNATVEFPDGNINARTSLKWTCLEHNHTFPNSPSSVMGKQKQWCKICKGQKIFDIQDFKDFAEEKGGKCLSKEYINYKTNLEFECAIGHRFSRTPAHLYDNKQPRWCSKCGEVKRYEEKKEFIIKELRKYVKDKGGTLLSIEEPIKYTSNASIKCKNGHTFKPFVESLIGRRTWCQKKGCWSPPTKLSYEFVKNTIEELGGTLLSEEYGGTHEKIRYRCNRCEKEHNRPFNYLTAESKGIFCPNCDNTRYVDYDIVKKAVEDRGGTLISEEYVSAQSGLKIKCSNGHITDTLRWNSIQNGRWCKDCTTPIGQSITRVIIEGFFNQENFPTIKPDWLKYKGYNLELDGYNESLNIAFEYQGIQHYERVYYQSDEDLRQLKLRDRSKRAKCKKRGTALIIVKQFKDYLNKDSMILHVKKSILKAGIEPLTKTPKIDFKQIHRFSELNEIREAAKQHDGKLLSEVYLGVDTKLVFECKYNHSFLLTPYNLLKKDSWCGNKKCKSERILESIKDKMEARKIEKIEHFKKYCNEIKYSYEGYKVKNLERKDGKNRRTIFLFMNCGKGHPNTETRESLFNRKPKCKDCTKELMTKISGMTIQDLNKYVKKYKGKCLADKSRGHSIKLPWRCKNGHEWPDTPWQIVANNKWCEDC